MLDLIKRLYKEEEGQGMVEYGLIIALIAVVVIGALTLMGTNVKAKFNEINTKLGGAASTD